MRCALLAGLKRDILYVGRLVESKGVQYLIEAFAKLAAERDNIALICIGDGPLENDWNRSARSCAGRGTYTLQGGLISISNEIGTLCRTICGAMFA
jgi:glycosyltransferase involved in cell wall biosynthesis